MKIKSVLLAIILIPITMDSISQDSIVKKYKWYNPTLIRIQYAGNVGMISVGPSWSLLNKKIELTSSLGFVPKFDAEYNIYITSIKFFYQVPLSFKVRCLTVKPVSLGITGSYTFGYRYNKYQDTSRFPKGYYWWDTALRAGLLYEADIYALLPGKNLNGIGLFFEASFWDLYIASKFYKDNHVYLTIGDIITFGLGIKLDF